jgi:hypothetical protein
MKLWLWWTPGWSVTVRQTDKQSPESLMLNSKLIHTPAFLLSSKLSKQFS